MRGPAGLFLFFGFATNTSCSFLVTTIRMASSGLAEFQRAQRLSIVYCSAGGQRMGTKASFVPGYLKF